MVKGKGKKRRCVRMPIQVPRSGGNFDPCPEGDFTAVLVDIVDLGMVTSEKFKKTQPKVMLAFQVDQLDEKGLPFLVFKRYTNSLHEKATLHGDLKRWLGKQFDVKALQKDLEILLGRGARLEIVQNEGSDGKVYSNIDRIRPLAADQKGPTAHPDFTRKKDRAEGQGPFGKHGKASDPDEGPEIDF